MRKITRQSKHQHPGGFYAALVPELIVELFAACQKGELQRAKALHDRLRPVTQAMCTVPRGGERHWSPSSNGMERLELAIFQGGC